MNNSKNKNKWLSVLIITSVIALAIAFSVIFSVESLDNKTLQLWLNQYLPQGLPGILVFISISSLMMTIGLPRQFVALSAGYILGTIIGTLVATLSATIACLLTILLAKKYFRSYVINAFPQQLCTVEQFFSQHTFAKAFTIRLLPAGSNFLTNVLAGLANIKIRAYLSGSCIGFLPQMYIFSLLGSGIRLEEQQQIGISLILLVIAVLLGVFLYRKERIAVRS